MKDIKQEALELGKSEAGGLLLKQVKRGKIKPEEVTDTLAKIDTTLSYGDFSNTDLVVEAVIENKNIKSSVLAEVEQHVKAECILTSNTSTISITELADSLQRPEQFCGMHFFNPVYRMPLVEVIRGEKSSETAIATTVAYAEAMGKTPIVVNDCAGFLVNRVLFPYFAGFDALVRDGVDIQRIDKVMEQFGWPMGPAYLLDVVGIDTAHHASEVMADAYPERMNKDFKSATDALYENNRFGQKNNVGFYKYELDKRGKQKKLPDEEASKIIETVRINSIEITDEEIIDRMMIPMCMETVRCVEEGIVDHPLDADMGLILGIAFPSFRGGALRYIEETGMQEFCDTADKLSHISPIYIPTKGLVKMAKKKGSFYPKVG
jgi:3-hydroxyacyl-CoA dehydrogenase/enoyl-CoA hydratase/3-hydroxybutyryl-CoA epimerase/enoyl-CoA isomerase